MAAKPNETGTQDHPLPSAPTGAASRPALISAFPGSLAFPLPPLKTPVGRDWLEQQGAPDPEVSGHHLVFSRAGSLLSVEDVGSRNGTWLDGVRLGPRERVPLPDGALIRIGRTLLVFREELQGPFTPSPPLGDLIGPFGLREIATAMAGWAGRPPPNIHIEGETGAGKELAAAAIARALRPGKPYGVLNMAAVAAGVFESQLFGHVAGAFSGAGRGAPGAVLANRGGAVFLDEIGELGLDLQPKLLRFLQSHEVQPVGSERPLPVDILVITATNRSLEELVEQGRFRRDFLARLATLQLSPLRERIEDVFAIAQGLAARRGNALSLDQVEVEAVERLLLDPWPMNVRGLEAAMSQIAALDPGAGLRQWAALRALGPALSSRPGRLAGEMVDREIAACAGNETQAARRLGVTRGKLRRFLAARPKH